MTDAKFRKFDEKLKGYIDEADIIRAFSSPAMQYPEHGARMMLRLFADYGKMDALQFQQMDQFLGRIHEVYRRLNSKQVSVEQFDFLLRELNILVDASTVQSLYDIACENFKGQIMSILSYQFAVILIQVVRKMNGLFVTSGALSISDIELLEISLWFL